MKLRMICEWGSSEPEVLEFLKSMDAASIFSERRFVNHKAFIFILQDNKQLYVGKDKTDHNALIRGAGPKRGVLEGAYFDGTAGPSAIGRIGYGILPGRGPEFPGSDKLELVAFYDHNSNPQAVQACIIRLLRDKLITNDAYVNFAGNLRRLSQAPLLKPMEGPTDEQKERSRLIAAMHLGTWPDGRRMSPSEKDALQKELGMKEISMKKHPWQGAMEKHGLAAPGQRWWAPTSESIE